MDRLGWRDLVFPEVGLDVEVHEEEEEDDAADDQDPHEDLGVGAIDEQELTAVPHHKDKLDLYMERKRILTVDLIMFAT